MLNSGWDARAIFVQGVWYVCLSILVVVFTIFPEGRFWALNVWSGAPLTYQLITLTVAILIPLLLWRLRGRLSLDADSEASSSKIYVALAAVVVLLQSAGFIVARATTFFEGDGYTVVSNLATSNPLMLKYRQLGESLVHIWLFRIEGVQGESGAALVYQSVSIGAGLIFCLTVGFCSMRLFRDNHRRLLFLAGMTSGGYMLLFFGHVENYSLFVLSVLVYCAIGCQTMRGGGSVAATIVAQVVVIFMHCLGLALIPATLYLVVAGTPLGAYVRGMSGKVKALTAAASVLAALGLLAWACGRSYFLRFAFVPLFENRFTYDGYTLLSPAHLLDMANLWLLLLPSLPVLVYLAVRRRGEFIRHHREQTWLALVSVCALSTTVLMDPKLGMARDWDIFAFAGVPVTMLFYLAVLNLKERHHALTIAFLSIVLSLVVLGGRVAANAIPGVAVQRFRSALILDEDKGRNSWVLLENYYRDTGDALRADEIGREKHRRFPEDALLERANVLYYREDNLAETVRLLYRIIGLNPNHCDAYGFLGFCYLDLKKYDTALTLIQIADGLSPDRPNNISNMARAHDMMNHNRKAERLYTKAMRLDPSDHVAPYNLSRLYRKTGNIDGARRFLEVASRKADAPVRIARELLIQYLRSGDDVSADSLMGENPRILDDEGFRCKLQGAFPHFPGPLVPSGQ